MTSYRIPDICNATVNSGLQKARIHMQNLFFNINIINISESRDAILMQLI